MKRCSVDYIKAKPCDICGDKGVVEAIITCCECKTSRQHLYCMRVVTTEAPPFWLCEECERRKLFSPTESDKDHKPEVLTPKVSSLIPKNTRVLKGPNKSVSASRFNFKEKRVDTGRTKYLSCDEAVKLSSGANQSSPSKNASAFKHGSSRSMAPPREKSLAKIYGATAATKFEPPLQQPIVQKSIAVKEKSDALSPRNKGDATESIKSPKSSGRVERTNTESFSPRSEFLSPRNKGDATESIKSPKSSGRVERTNTKSFSPRSEVLSPRNRGDATESVMSTKSSGRVDKTNTESFSPRSEVLPPTKEADIRKHIEVPKSSKELEKIITQESTKMESEALAAIKEEADIGKHIEVHKSSKELEKIITQESTKMAKSEALVAIKEEADIEVPKILEKLKNTNVKAGGKRNHANVEDESSEPNLIMGGPISEMHDTSIPAIHSYWKGSFNLPNEHGNLNGAFKAHPPSRVHCKVYETLHKMPENINFELVPIDEVWMDLFQGDCPYKDDIGLYFFPRFKERYEKCTSLIDFLWSKNLVMKSFVDKVELFVFSSRYLQLHSQQFEGNYFLWGVFRPSKVKKDRLSKSKSMVVHDFPPGFEKMQKPPPRG